MVEVTPDPWLSMLLGKPAGRLKLGEAAADAELCRAQLAAAALQFCDVRVAAERTDWLRVLSQLGFYTVDATVTLELPPEAELATVGVTPVVPIAVYAEGTGAAIADSLGELAGRSFRYSRFHLDPAIPTRVANQIKAEWARNCCLGKRGDRCFVAYKDNSPAGFLAALLGQEGEHCVATIDLIAVDELLRGRGFGCALVAAFASLYRKREARLRVGTQIANIPALRFYQCLGFVVARSAYVLHYHAGV